MLRIPPLLCANQTMQHWTTIKAVHYTYPVVSLLYFVAATTFSVCTLHTLSLKIKDQKVRRDVILWLMVVFTATYVSYQLINLL